MANLLQDVRYGVRTLLKNPGFTAVCVVTLALAIGGNSTVFTFVDTVLLRPLPYADPERLVIAQSANNEDSFGSSPPDYYTMRQENRSFEHLAAFYFRPYNVTGAGEPERVRSGIVTSEFFRTLGIAPPLGRDFVAQDEQWGSNRVVILSHGLWQRRFDGDPQVIGRTVQLNGEPYTIIAVAPGRFDFLDQDPQLWVPMSFAPDDNANTRNNFFLTMLGRLKPGTGVAAGEAELKMIAARLAKEFPQSAGITAKVRPMHEYVVESVRRALLMLMAGVLLVLLIACVNIANLLLARASSRDRELAIRSALGASRTRLITQLLVEAVLLALVGGGLGLLLANWGVAAMRSLAGTALPRASELRLNWGIAAFTFALSAGAGVLFGIAPAFRAAGTSAGAVLKEARTVGGRARSQLRASLIVSEVALAFVLVAAAGLMIHSLYRLLRVDLGLDPSSVTTAQLTIPASRYIDRDAAVRYTVLSHRRATAFFDSLLQRMEDAPGTMAAGAVSKLPMSAGSWGKQITLLDRAAPTSMDDVPVIQYRVVAGDYFGAVRMRMQSGRHFATSDNGQSPPVGIVNSTMARRFWGHNSPIGKQLLPTAPASLLPSSALPPGYVPPKIEIVGVVEDVKEGELSSEPPPTVYVPYVQGAETLTSMYVVLRSTTDTATAAGLIRETVRELDREVPIANVSTLEQGVRNVTRQPRMNAVLLGVFAGLAVMLSAVGIYGVMAYSVGQRTSEIGIRMALGATPREILRLITGEASRLVLLGWALGLAGAIAAGRLLAGFLYGVKPHDIATLLIGSLVLATIALVASIIPARRAAGVDPMVALRYE